MNDVEQREAARQFVIRWMNSEKNENRNARSFWIELMQVLGDADATQHLDFEKTVVVNGSSRRIDVYVPETHVIIEHKSSGVDLDKKSLQSGGDMLTPYEQAKRYNDNLNYEERAKWIVTSNFDEIRIYNLNAYNEKTKKPITPEETVQIIKLEEIQHKYNKLSFLINKAVKEVSPEVEISKEAGKYVDLIYSAFLKQYDDPNAPETLHALNILCVRLVFLYYSEDAGIFKKDQFLDYIRDFAPNDARRALRDLFDILSTPKEKRDKYLAKDTPKLAAFPYVNGGLFNDADKQIEIPPFTQELLDAVIKASKDFDWSPISPTIFGAVFESTLNPETRRKGGMHYTSIENIHKVIDPLFLDDLKAELKSLIENYKAHEHEPRNKKKAIAELEDFRKKLASLKFLDPACGSGNFLTETFISLRRLENEVLSITYERGSNQTGFLFVEASPIKVSIQQFYGIEINDFACTVAQTALWIAEAQMLKQTDELLHIYQSFLPLDTYTNIKEGNALRMDWGSLVNSGQWAVNSDAPLGDNASYVVKMGDNASRVADVENTRPGGDASYVADGDNTRPGGDANDLENTRPGGDANDLGNTQPGGDASRVADVENTRPGGDAIDLGNTRPGGDASRVASKYDAFDYIMGNPPFVGYSLQSKSQKEDILSIYVDEKGRPYKTAGKIDYVSAWYFKAAQLMHSTNTCTAFVSTNSITQGEQVANVWKPLFERFGIHIDFAWRTFRWDSESTEKAHVHCVIVGFNSCKTTKNKYIYDGDNKKDARNINAYLIDANDVWIENSNKPLCDVPEMLSGNRPTDGGHLLLSAEEANLLIKTEPSAKKYIKHFMMGYEFINNIERYCLWLVNISPSELREMPLVKERIRLCKLARENSPDKGRVKLAETPHLFREQVNPQKFIAIPKVSSEQRRYIPIGYLNSNTIAGDKLFMIPDATLYHFGVLTSNVHMAWMRAVCGRLKSDYSYSNTIVYNNFPWPELGNSSRVADSGNTRPGGDASRVADRETKYINPFQEVHKTQGHLPHWHQNEKLYFITFRLADSLPQSKLESLEKERNVWLNNHPEPRSPEEENEYTERFKNVVEKWLDAKHGQCILKFPTVQNIVESAIRHFDGERYQIHSFVIMPNHVHILLDLKPHEQLTDVLHSIKSYSAHEINKILGTSGNVWQRESYDRLIRNEEHYEFILRYIESNAKSCNFGVPYFDATRDAASPGQGASFDATRAASSPGQIDHRARIEATAQAILDARALYPDSSLADLYDETTMPVELRKAHQANDRAVMAAYGFDVKTMSEQDCVARLMEMYQALVEKEEAMQAKKPVKKPRKKREE